MVSDPYRRFAKYYDLLYKSKLDYEAETKWILKAFNKYGKSIHSVMDLGCGTGNHAIVLAKNGYEAVGLDRSVSMLSVARENAEVVGVSIEFVEADMSSFSIGRSFDAIICMFGGWGYLLNDGQVRSALRRVRFHLEPGGLFMVEFWGVGGTRDNYRTWNIARNGVKLVRYSESTFDKNRRRVSLTMHHLVYRQKEIIDEFTDNHILRCYRLAEMRRLLETSGFRVRGFFTFERPPKGFKKALDKDFNIVAIGTAR